MASGTIQIPSSVISYTTNMGTGTGSVSVLNGCRLRVGQLVTVSARLKVNQNISDAMNAPLVYLDVGPINTYTSIPSVITIVRSGSTPVTYSGLVKIIKMNGNYYATQQVSSALATNDEVDMQFSYPTDS